MFPFIYKLSSDTPYWKSVQVFMFFIAGDILHMEVFRSWEFNSSFPLRSIVLPYMICAPPFLLIRHLVDYGILQTSHWIYPHLLLILPRLAVTLLSIIVDCMVYKSATILGLKRKNSLWFYASSYITIVYFTRTLSNSLESFLFTALLYIVLKEWKRARSKALFNQCSSAPIAAILVAGVFNRPTFLLFAFMPCLLWVCYDLKKYNLSELFKHGFAKLLACASYVAFFAAVFVVCDSLYFGSVSFNDFTNFHDFLGSPLAFLEKLTITPVNFVIYNMQPSNLAEHGLHPHIQHLAVNTPLLFNILAVCIIIDACKLTYLFRLQNKQVPMLSWEAKTDIFLMLVYFFPVAFLSIFPHQEPRFIIPLLTPLMLYYRHLCHHKWATLVTLIWIIANLGCALFYGGLHQAGVVPAVQYYSRHQLQDGLSNTTVVFFHTYMPPRYLLSMPQVKQANKPDMSAVVDLKGADMETLLATVDNLSKEGLNIIVISPATVIDKCRYKYKGDHILLTEENSFKPHISTEDLPKVSQLLCEDVTVMGCYQKYSELTIWERLLKLLALNVYSVEVQHE